jgi:hypothetical protein
MSPGQWEPYDPDAHLGCRGAVFAAAIVLGVFAVLIAAWWWWA